jgi:hypothetical protein
MSGMSSSSSKRATDVGLNGMMDVREWKRNVILMGWTYRG